MKRNLLLFICLASVIIILAGCLGATPTTSDPPILKYSFAPKLGNVYVTGGQVVDFVISSNMDDSGYAYAWSVSGGTPTSGNAKTFSWTAPVTLGQYTVTAIVSKDSTQKATKTWTVNVCLGVTFSGKIKKGGPGGGSAALPGATIEIIGTGFDIYSTTSDSLGDYTFTNVPAGTFFVRMAESSIKTVYDLWPTTMSGVAMTVLSPADFSAQLAVAGITADLNTKSIVDGMICENGSTPLSGVTVTITPSSGKVGYIDTGYNPALTATSSGVYFISDIPNGIYTITPAKAGKTFIPLELEIKEPAVFTSVSFLAQ